MRYLVDRSYERHDLVILGGSPMRILRVAPGAIGVLTDLETAAELHPSPSEQALLDRLEDAGLIHPAPDLSARPSPHQVPIITPIYRRPFGDTNPPASSFLGTVPEALLVDDGSDPPIREARIRLDSNAGPAAARNAGLEQAVIDFPGTDYVIFLDADVDPGPDPHWYAPLLALCERDPRLAVVAPRVCSRSGPSRLERYERNHSPLDLGDQPGQVHPGTRIGYLPSTALLCRVSALQEVSGFSADLRFGEDVDLIWRLIAAGWKCRYHPDVVVHHPPRSRWAAWSRQRIGYGTSAAALALRHGDKVAPARLHPISLVTWMLILSGHLALGGVAIAGSALSLAHKVPDLPGDVATRLSLSGTWRSGLGLARAIRRVWWPVLVPLAVISRRVRRLLVLSLIASGTPRVDTAITIADDLSYSLGVWIGVVKQLRTRPATASRRRALWSLLPATSTMRQTATVRT
jgi:mycofactocin glycosyltransferase